MMTSAHVSRLAILIGLIFTRVAFAENAERPDLDPERDRASASSAARAVVEFVEQARLLQRESPMVLQLGSMTLEWVLPEAERPRLQADVPAWSNDSPAWSDDARRAARVTSDWTPYAGPFDEPEATHLLRRAVCGARLDEIDSAVGLGLPATLDKLLALSAAPPPPADWATEPIPADLGEYTPAMIDSLLMLYGDRMQQLRLWWSDRFLEVPTSLPSVREEMVLFWHDHFATQAAEVALPQSMYVQNALFRQHATGNVRTLVKSIFRDPAMLLYLNNQENHVDDINENFARELLELFTMGLDQYTQMDIIEAARSFTGYVTFDGVTSMFVASLHDYGDKTFLGQTGNWFGPDIIDIIFQQDATATFLCNKLYRYFVDEYPPPGLIDQLAVVMRANDYEVAPVLRYMFASEHFFDPTLRGSIITDGIDRSLGVARSLYLGELDLFDGYGGIISLWAFYAQYFHGQVLLDPPNVAGWPGYRDWVNTTTLTWRKIFGASLVDGDLIGTPLGVETDVIALANELSNPHDPLQIVDDLSLYLFGMPPTALVRQRMIDELLQGSEPYDWSIFDPSADDRLMDLLRLMIRLPDFQTK